MFADTEVLFVESRIKSTKALITVKLNGKNSCINSFQKNFTVEKGKLGVNSRGIPKGKKVGGCITHFSWLMPHVSLSMYLLTMHISYYRGTIENNFMSCCLNFG